MIGGIHGRFGPLRAGTTRHPSELPRTYPRETNVRDKQCRRLLDINELIQVQHDSTQALHRDAPDGELLIDGKVRVACVDAQRMKPKRLPQFVVEGLV